MKILIVEDEQDLIKTMMIYFSNLGYKTEIANTFFSAEDKVICFEYDVFLIDVGLPDGSGLDLLKLIHEHQKNAGILILSAKDSLDDKLKGLDIGADDYLTKPFHLTELNSRINAILRRKKFDGNDELIFNEFTINVNLKECRANSKKLDLTTKEFELFQYFILNKDRILTKQNIAEHLWGDYMEQADNFDFIYTHLRNLRKKIKNAGAFDYIETVYGIGYKLKS